ncbi:hypothetical protein HOY80DRAFT_942826 [Tuber brumale]|nr:hypothetical protein HOY80DRAFT_942826 [Tuber brumale]
MMMVVGGGWWLSKLTFFFCFILIHPTVPVCLHMVAYHEISNGNHNASDAVSKKEKVKAKKPNRNELNLRTRACSLGPVSEKGFSGGKEERKK